MKVNIPIEYMVGHMSGRMEGEVNFTKEEFEEFKSLYDKMMTTFEDLTKKEYDKYNAYINRIYEQTTIIVDSYEIDDMDFDEGELFK